MTDRRRAVIAAILADPDATASERLRALELERALEPSRADLGFDEQVGKLEDETLDSELDAFLVPDVVRSVLRDEEVMGINPDAWPCTAIAVRSEVDAMVEARVRELVDLDAREREVRERAEALARQLYRDRAFEVATDALEASCGTGPAGVDPTPIPTPEGPQIASERPPPPAEAHPVVDRAIAVLRRWDDSPPEPGIRRRRR